MPPTPSLSPPVWCSKCHRYCPATDFKRNRLGNAYSTCKTCCERRRNRQPLQELEINVISGTRTTRARADATLKDLRPRKRARRVEVLVDEPEPRATVEEGVATIGTPIRVEPPVDVGLNDEDTPFPPSRIPILEPRPMPVNIPERTVNPSTRRRGRPPRAPQGFLANYDSRLPPFTLGPLGIECSECEALHFIGEAKSRARQTFESCCKGGDVALEKLRRPPDEIRSLITDRTGEGEHFRANFRAYNMALCFTSMSYNKDERVDTSRGISSFSIHGELYHFQGPLVPGSQEPPVFAQLFFYDPAYANGLRADRNPSLQLGILARLTGALMESNCYIRLYRTAKERLQQYARDVNYRILLNPQLRLVMEAGADRRRENLPTAAEVAGVLPYEYESTSSRDIVLTLRNPTRNGPQLQRVNVTHAAYMPLHYVLFFPYGDGSDLGWHYGLDLLERGCARKRTRLEQRHFYRFRLHTRRTEFSSLFYGSRLFQQYVVDAFAACESTALDWLRKNQDKLRADIHSGLQDALIRGDTEVTELGRRFILPSSFTGGDRFMQQLFQDSMAIVRHFGKPTFFITFTANPNWPEIRDNLFLGQQAIDRPDLVARVFHLYVNELLADLRKGLFGPYAGHVYTIEYQKRGLPHMHLLLFLEDSSPFKFAANIDEVVCAELPDRSWDPTGELTQLVIRQLTHGPCGEDNPRAPCMVRKNPQSPLTCSKRFPKPFVGETIVLEDSYPQYRRRNDGRSFSVPKPGSPSETVVRNNQWVVPYNPYLLRKYRSHINVEVCATVQAVKYIHKYVYKGADRTTLAVSNTNDEITRYLQARYITPVEACWRLFENRTHSEFPPVQHLAVHLEGQQVVYFDESLTPDSLAQKLESTNSTLMAYFQYNSLYDDQLDLLYSDFPKRMTWDQKTRVWKKRKGKTFAIGRMYHCSPIAGERYYLRLLLTVSRGVKSFAHLRTVDGLEYPSFRAACIAKGLVEDNEEWIQCFDEAVLFTSGHGLRTLFLTGLRQNLIPDPLDIWNRYREHFCDDLRHRLSRFEQVPLALQDPEYDYGLFLLAQGLEDQHRTLTDVFLPVNTFDWTALHVQDGNLSDRERWRHLASTMYSQLNPDQLSCFETITTAIATDPETAHFYLQGPGGTGKTFLYSALCYHYRSRGLNVLCVASTGIAALLLPSGRTSHSAFKIPIVLHESSTCGITKNSKAAADLLRVGLIIWDEVPMQHKYCFEAMHRLFTDLRSTTDDVLFGGVPVILGGDFAQILPVIPRGTRSDIVTACIQHSFIWPRLQRLRLRTNMRVRNGSADRDFVQWLQSLPYHPDLQGSIQLPRDIRQVDTLSRLVSQVYPPALLRRAPIDPKTFDRRAILTTLNTTVTDLNSAILNDLPGVVRTYEATNSADLNEATEGLDELPPEFLQSITLPSLPLSRLQLKIGAPVMLLRNLCPLEGLCNGTRMVVTGLRNHCLEVRLLGGDFDGQLRTIPRITLQSSEADLSFVLSRKQFPVRLAFAMTINKSQGQSLDCVGVDLRSPVFSHGQFYVAVSRVSSVAGLSILLPKQASVTENIVWPEVLEPFRN